MKNFKLILIFITLIFGGFFCLKNSFLTSAQKGDPFKYWRPTKTIAGIKFVGNQECLKCHNDKQQLDTPMAHAILKPADSKMLDEFPPKPFKNGNYTYEVKKEGDKVTYTVSDGKNTQSFPVLYSFGEGRKAQVYIFKYKDALYESRVSLYRGIKGLDFTIAQPQQPSATLESAIGREIPTAEVQTCFNCHSTGSVSDGKFMPENIIEAVSCEACHGAGENHINSVIAGDQNLQIFNPAHLTAIEQTQDYCGACHIGFEQVLKMSKDVNTTRFQPYRLFMSKSHDTNDPRLSCTACHSPHDKLEENPVNYDTKCFACHASTTKEKLTKEHFAAACPVKTSNCVTCHMPQTEIPEIHGQYADHQIRIVKNDKK